MHTLFVVLTRAWPHRNDIGSIQNFEREVESIWNSFYTFISIQKTWFILAFLYFYLYMYVIVQWSVLCRFDPYVLYLEYSTFSDKLFSRALYRLSLTDQMDCKSQKRSNRYRKYYTELEWWTSQLPFAQPKIRYWHALIQMH